MSEVGIPNSLCKFDLIHLPKYEHNPCIKKQLGITNTQFRQSRLNKNKTQTGNVLRVKITYKFISMKRNIIQNKF